MIRASVFAFALLAAACTPPASETPPEDAVVETPAPATPLTRAEATAQDTCGAAQYRAMIGTPITAATFPSDPNIRVIMPDSVVTEDFRVERLNVHVNSSGVIDALECY